MKFFLNSLFTLIFLLGSQHALSEDTFILNYEEVDIKKVTQDIAQFSKKSSYFRSKS